MSEDWGREGFDVTREEAVAKRHTTRSHSHA